MDEAEVTNSFWLEYLYWLNRVYGDSYREVVQRALPDTLAGREKLAYNEPHVDYYLRHPAYQDYPVVGVSGTKRMISASGERTVSTSSCLLARASSPIAPKRNWTRSSSTKRTSRDNTPRDCYGRFDRFPTRFFRREKCSPRRRLVPTLTPAHRGRMGVRCFGIDWKQLC